MFTYYMPIFVSIFRVDCHRTINNNLTHHVALYSGSFVMLKVLKFTNKSQQSKLIILLKCAPKFRILHVKFVNFPGVIPPDPLGGRGRPILPHPSAAWLHHARGRALPPGSADPDPHSYFNTPKFKILYNTLVCKHLISLDCHEGDIHSRIFKFIGQINVQFHTSW